MLSVPSLCNTPREHSRNLIIVMGGQGARRKRNWRHNRPNSPYKWMPELPVSAPTQRSADWAQSHQPGDLGHQDCGGSGAHDSDVVLKDPRRAKRIKPLEGSSAAHDDDDDDC